MRIYLSHLNQSTQSVYEREKKSDSVTTSGSFRRSGLCGPWRAAKDLSSFCSCAYRIPFTRSFADELSSPIWVAVCKAPKTIFSPIAVVTAMLIMTNKPVSLDFNHNYLDTLHQDLTQLHSVVNLEILGANQIREVVGFNVAEYDLIYSYNKTIIISGRAIAKWFCWLVNYNRYERNNFYEYK